jgi:gas vesicle protein
MRKSKSENTVKKIAIGAAIAAAAGYITGLLTAPKSGKETRDDIKNTAVKGKTAPEKELKKLHTELRDLLGDVKEKGSDLGGKTAKDLKDLADKASAAKEKTREVLSALHEGDAEDKDLKRALTEANKAIDNLRKYIKK